MRLPHMRIGFDGTTLGRNTTGVSCYIRNLATALGREKDIELLLYLRRTALSGWSTKGARLGPWQRMVSARALVGAVTWPYLTRRDKVQVFHSSGYSLPCAL